LLSSLATQAPSVHYKALSCSRWWSTCSYQSEKIMFILFIICNIVSFPYYMLIVIVSTLCCSTVLTDTDQYKGTKYHTVYIMSIGWLPSENCNLYFLNYQKFIPLMHSHIEANPEEHQSVLSTKFRTIHFLKIHTSPHFQEIIHFTTPQVQEIMRNPNQYVPSCPPRQTKVHSSHLGRRQKVEAIFYFLVLASRLELLNTKTRHSNNFFVVSFSSVNERVVNT
jgi:hypothetical protein